MNRCPQQRWDAGSPAVSVYGDQAGREHSTEKLTGLQGHWAQGHAGNPLQRLVPFVIVQARSSWPVDRWSAKWQRSRQGLALGMVPHAGNAQEAGVVAGGSDGEPTERVPFTACAAGQLETTCRVSIRHWWSWKAELSYSFWGLNACVSPVESTGWRTLLSRDTSYLFKNILCILFKGFLMENWSKIFPVCQGYLHSILNGKFRERSHYFS